MNEQEQLRHWLEDDSCMPFVCNARFGQNILVKSYKSEQIRYLFHQYCYGEEIIQRRSKFDYCGIYFKGDGLIYDADEDFDLVGPELLAPKNRRQMQTDVQSGVRAYINDRVRNNPDNLEISELTDTALIKRVNYFQQQGEHEEAREMFLRGETPEDISFACEYEFSYWDEQNLLDYIHNPVHFIKGFKEDLIVFAIFCNFAVLCKTVCHNGKGIICRSISIYRNTVVCFKN